MTNEDRLHRSLQIILDLLKTCREDAKIRAAMVANPKVRDLLAQLQKLEGEQDA